MESDKNKEISGSELTSTPQKTPELTTKKEVVSELTSDQKSESQLTSESSFNKELFGIPNSSTGSEGDFIYNNNLKNNVLSVVSNVGNVGNVCSTDKTDNLQLLLRRYPEIVGVTLLMRTLRCLYLIPNISYQSIANHLSADVDSIIQAISRKDEYFLESGREGKSKLISLSKQGKAKVEEAINLFKNKQEMNKNSLSEKEEQLKKKEELFLSSKQLISNCKINRVANSIYLNFNDILSLDPAYAEYLLANPEITIESIKETLVNPLDIRIINLPDSCKINIENLRAEHINKLICLEGRCVSLSNVRPIVKTAKFECPNCGALLSTTCDETIREPSRCSCGWKGNFKLLSKVMVNGSNLMMEDLQERTENANLQRLKCLIQNDLVDPFNIPIFYPGNEIKAIGILREKPLKIAGKVSSNMGLFFEILSAELFEPEISISTLSGEEIKEIKETANKISEDGINKVLVPSFAPDIHDFDKIKEAIMLKLCMKRNNNKIKKTRNKINILMIGDPGVAKSVLGEFMISITPGSRKAVGGSSSAVGLTASVEKEEENLGGYRVNPGALVLAKEELFLDEMNNMADDDKPKMQEALSESQITVNKASIHVSLKVSCGLIAAANPKDGTFTETDSLQRQFNIPVPILNRFDLIFIIKDRKNKERDKLIAEKMLQREEGELESIYSKEFLKKFFIYVRNQPDPKMTPMAREALKEVYSEIRQGNTNKFLVNPRLMEAMTRLAKASAKIRLSEIVEVKDVNVAIDIIGSSHYSESYSRFFSELEVKDV